MNAFAFLLSCLVFLPVFNRLRLVNWRNARAYAVLQYLFQAGIAFWAMWDACAGVVDGYQWILLAFVATWQQLTREDWSDGVPDHIQTGVDDLGPPELERFK